MDLAILITVSNLLFYTLAFFHFLLPVFYVAEVTSLEKSDKLKKNARLCVQ